MVVIVEFIYVKYMLILYDDIICQHQYCWPVNQVHPCEARVVIHGKFPADVASVNAPNKRSLTVRWI